MPSTAPLITIQNYLDGYRKNVVGRRNPLLDVRSGSGYEIPSGVNAVLMARQARRDQVLFNNAYSDTATGTDLDRHMLLKYEVARIEATNGSGTAILVRPTTGGGAGTLYEGSRILVLTTGIPTAYKIAADTLVGASQTLVQVPIEAVQVGAGVAVNTTIGLQLGDQLFDTTFTVQSMNCGDGTDQEQDDDYRTRARGTLLTRRVGYAPSIIAACNAVGATQVVFLDADSLGPSLDAGLNFLYVGDDSYTTTPALLQACQVAIDGWRVAGCDVQVCGMQQTALTLGVTINLWSDPGNFNLMAIQAVVTAAILDAFDGTTNWWTFSLTGLGGLIQSVSSAIQSVVITSNPGAPPVAWQGILTRYIVQTISVVFQKGS